MHQPGTFLDYNNADYVILGKIVEVTAKASFAEALRKSILSKVGLVDSGLCSRSEIVPSLADTYFFREELRRLTPDLPVYWENWHAAGAMYSTAEDLLRFSINQLGSFEFSNTMGLRILGVPKFWHSSVDEPVSVCQKFGMSIEVQPDDFTDLSRRERQILTVLYRLQKASAAEIRAALTNPPTYTAVRTHLTLLEDKGHVKHATEGPRYIYSPVVPREEMCQRVIDDILKNFFDDSVEQAVTAFVKRDEPLSDAQLERLEQLIQQARKEGR